MDDYVVINMGASAPVASETPRCPINVAARRSGLSAHVIRAWERRYSAITPDRTSKSRRLYSDWEVRRLILLRQAVELGHRIGEIARLPMEQLRPLVGRDTVPGVEASPRIPLPRSRLIELALEAVAALDGAAFSQALLQATRTLGMPELFDDFIEGLSAELRQRVAARRLRPAHERVAQAALRSFLGDLLAAGNAGISGPSLVIATQMGEADESRALAAAVMACRAGWNPVYTGAGLPFDELAFIARQRGAAAVILALPPGFDAARLPGETACLRAAMGGELPVVCVGAPVASMHDLGRQLEEIRHSAQRA